MAADTSSCLKDRVEQTLANLFIVHPVLANLIPRKENEADKPARPYMAIVAKPGKEVSPGMGVFRTPVTVELNFDSKKTGQNEDDLDVSCAAVEEQIAVAQTAGDYGLIREGDAQEFDGATGRKRVFNLTVFAG